jgi:hypothetical protein
VVLEREALKLSNRTAHVALFDTFNDSEVGLLLVDLRTGRFTGECFDVVAIAEARDPITTMGGVRMVPDAALAELDPSGSDVLVLAGGDMWDAGGGRVFDERKHTSASAEYLAMTGYAGRHHYVDERAVIDGDLITAGPQSPVQFARATLARLGLASERTLDAYERLFHGADTSAFPVLMQTGAGG